MSTATLMTVEQFAHMNTAETEDFELVEGELTPLPSATPQHAWIRDEIRFALAQFLRSNPTGVVLTEVDCRLSESTVRRPDVIFIASGRTISFAEVPIPFAPDLAVEVLSPSESAINVNRRVLDYLNAGTKEVWVVDHENSEVFISNPAGIRLLRGDEAIETPMLDGFRLPLTHLFRKLQNS